MNPMRVCIIAWVAGSCWALSGQQRQEPYTAFTVANGLRKPLASEFLVVTRTLKFLVIRSQDGSRRLAQSANVWVLPDLTPAFAEAVPHKL